MALSKEERDLIVGALHHNASDWETRWYGDITQEERNAAREAMKAGTWTTDGNAHFEYAKRLRALADRLTAEGE